ncbi:glycosyltransferase family 2 protein [Polynucleobacter sp. KF022]|uniref:glycosyltransferase family 2 protein n=1 Tax=Polynucleobacter sp. KF022 TaxID=2982615 RepID=UPI002491F7C9|nr:glycosyltransferase family 2 protein [Polynucleobacter sp. KF022]
MIDLSIVIPIYRSENSIRELHQRLVDQLNKIYIEFEIVFVEDCGGDNSWNIIKDLVADDVRVCGMRMSRNYGQHNALLAGIRAARGNLIVTVDDDLQHPPEEIPRLLTELQKGFDVVYGFPQREQHGFFRNIASQITKIALQKSMGAQTARHVSAFRVFKTELRDAFKDFTGPSVNIDVLLTWGAAKFSAIPVKHDERKYGASNYTTRKLIQHAINMVTGFSTIPLKIAGILGFLFSIFGILVLAYVLSQYLLHGSIVPGFAFIASIVAIFSGAQLFALGIMGEYLARIYQRTMERPAYVIRESV